MNLEEIRRDVIAKLVEKYGEDKVNEVNNFDPEIVYAISQGTEVVGVTEEQYEIIYDFTEWLVNHPKSNCTKPYVRPNRFLN